MAHPEQAKSVEFWSSYGRGIFLIFTRTSLFKKVVKNAPKSAHDQKLLGFGLL
jgi:hypothetical protein